MIIDCGSVFLRPFDVSDAADLYAYAKDPRIGTAAGWKPHESVKESAEIIRTVFSAPDTFAVVDKASGKVIGSAGYTGRRRGAFAREDEIGYALSAEFWGRGIMPEVVRALLRHGFTRMGLEAVWCSHYDDNSRSRRVIEKCGFRPVFSEMLEDGTGEHLTHFYVITAEEWNK